MSSCWQKCSDTRDAIPLYRSRGLYLKPVALLHISVQLPQLKLHGKAISDWEIMDKLKHWIKPEEFVLLKVSKKTLEFVRFDAEIQNKMKLHTVLRRLDGRSIKISGFKEELKVRAVESKGDFPTKHDWDSFFRDAKDMNEMKAGERPDTVYLSHLPCKWFSSGIDCDKPSERVIRKVFEQFGEIKHIDVPMLDVYRNKMNNSISGVKLFTFHKNIIFEVYIQYKEYFCFVKCMDAFRGMKLVYIDDSRNAYSASIKVDFDRSKHLSDASVHRRQIVRERLEKKEKERMEKEMKQKEEEEKRREQERLEKIERRKQREQKRKEKQLEKLKLKEVDDMSEKIATEEYLLLMAQRKLESIRLLGELLNRIKNEKERQEVAPMNLKRKKRSHENEDANNIDDTSKTKSNCVAADAELDTEKDLRYKLIQKFKKLQQRELVKEKVKLRALVTDGSNSDHKVVEDGVLSATSGSDTEQLLHNRLRADNYDNDRRGCLVRPRGNFRRGGRDRSSFTRTSVMGEDFQNSRGRFQRGRRNFGARSMYSNRLPYQSPMLMPFMDPVLLSYSHEYYKYLQKIASESQRSKRSASSRSYSRSRSGSWSRSRSRSRRSYSRRRSSSRSASKSWSRSRSRTRSRSTSRERNKQEREVKNRGNRVENVVDESRNEKNGSSVTASKTKSAAKAKKHKKNKKKKKTTTKENEQKK